MIGQGLAGFRHKRVLLLQGPIGPFFYRLSKDLTRAGAEVFKVNFHGGDWLYYRGDAINFRGDIDAWPAFFAELLERLDIDTILLFGDCRAYHTVAYDIAHQKGIEVGVFEEGYLRPDYVTFERSGVNGYSTLPKNPIYYLNKPPVPPIKTEPVGNAFWYGVLWAILYYVAAYVLKPVFSRYRHHRPISFFEMVAWLRAPWRKFFYAFKERGLQDRLAGPLSKKFFLVPLQVHNDAQIHVHSDFDSVDAFIRHVVTSFASHAPDGTMLVFKHHPMDRGYCDYTQLLQALVAEFGMAERVLYIHDLHLPSLLQHALGVVLVNSTVGLQALYHKAPLIVCGECIYDIKGLVYQDTLDNFWNEAEHVEINTDLFHRFRNHLVARTQLNGNFYKRLAIAGSATGMHWGERGAQSRNISFPAMVEQESQNTAAANKTQALIH